MHTSIHFHPSVSSRYRSTEKSQVPPYFFIKISSRYPFSVPPPFSSKRTNKKYQQVENSESVFVTYAMYQLFQERSNGNWSRLLARHLTLDIILRNKEYSIGFLNSSPNGYPPNCWNVASGRAGFLNSRSTSREHDPPQRCPTY